MSSQLGNGSDDRNPPKVEYVPFEPGDSKREYSHALQGKRETTAHRMAQVLVWAFVLSLPLYVLLFLGTTVGRQCLAAFVPSTILGQIDLTAVDRIFDRWYTVISTLVGAAFGFYYGSAGKGR